MSPPPLLSAVETETLFALCRDLVQGRRLAIVFVSHRLPEVLRICDRYTVLRNGRLAASAPITPQTTADQLVAHMLGTERKPVRAPGLSHSGRESTVGARPLQPGRQCPEGLPDGGAWGGRRPGRAGGGGEERAVQGRSSAILPRAAGEIWLDGSPVALRGPADAVALGMGLVPEERRKQGLFLGESVSFHLGIASLKKWSRLSFLSRKKLEENAGDRSRDWGSKPPRRGRPWTRLSGGNQQKAVVGKWLAAGCRLCLFDEPTKGVGCGRKGGIAPAHDRAGPNGLRCAVRLR